MNLEKCALRLQGVMGFTLIELLVVVSIIALLIGILLPALGKARAASRDTQCLSNVKYLALCNYNYAVDNKVFVGYTGGIDRKQRLLDYANSGKNNSDASGAQIWNCPSNKRLIDLATGNALEASYGFNTLTNHAKLERVMNPAETVFLADGGVGQSGDPRTATHLMAPGNSSWSTLCRPNPRHNSGTGANVAWADGHGSFQSIASDSSFYAHLPDPTLGVAAQPPWWTATMAVAGSSDYANCLWDLD